MRRLLASRDLKRRQRRRDAGGGDGVENVQVYGGEGEYEDNEDEELDPMTYRDSWTQTRPEEEPAERENAGLPFPRAERDLDVGSGASLSDSDAYYGRSEEEEEEEDDEPYFEGVGSAGFSNTDGLAGRPSGQQQQQWERVAGRPRPRRRRPARSFQEEGEGSGFRSSGRRARGEASSGGERGWGEESGPTLYGGEHVDDSRLGAGRRAER